MDSRGSGLRSSESSRAASSSPLPPSLSSLKSGFSSTPRPPVFLLSFYQSSVFWKGWSSATFIDLSFFKETPKLTPFIPICALLNAYLHLSNQMRLRNDQVYFPLFSGNFFVGKHFEESPRTGAGHWRAHSRQQQVQGKFHKNIFPWDGREF